MFHVSSCCLVLSDRSLVRWWYGRSLKDTDGNVRPGQWETDYLLNSGYELRMFYEYHDMGTRFNHSIVKFVNSPFSCKSVV